MVDDCSIALKLLYDKLVKMLDLNLLDICKIGFHHLMV